MSHALSHDVLLKQENARYHRFIQIAMILAVLTGIEIVIIFLPWPYWIILWGLIILSTIKFVFVILWFMHLIYDQILLFLLFMSGMLLATGTMIALLLLMSPKDVDTEAFACAPPAMVRQAA